MRSLHEKVAQAYKHQGAHFVIIKAETLHWCLQRKVLMPPNNSKIIILGHLGTSKISYLLARK